VSSRTVDMSPSAITARLVQASEVSDLSAELRLTGKIDMSAEAIGKRLREAAALLELSLRLGGGR